MGFLVDACSIFIGGILGSIFGKKFKINDYSTLSIGIMLISVVGLLENILSINNGRIVGAHTVIVCIALVAGCAIGNALKIEDRLYSLSKAQTINKNGFIDSVLFFGIGGLQISGPILYALNGDSFQLILKGIIDFPFALMLGAAYGKTVSLSSAVVLSIQLIIAGAAAFLGNFISADMICQLCSLGYLILFFSGFNMVCPSKKKVKNMNIIPGMFLIIIYNTVLEVISR